MEKAVEFRYFVIRYIEKYNLDNSIGTGREKPQIWYIPDKGHLYELTEESALNTLENKIQDMLEKMKSTPRLYLRYDQPFSNNGIKHLKIQQNRF
jgi:hypothetical protein